MPITHAEAHVLELLWARSPQTMREMHAVLSGSRGWRLGTVMSLTARLAQKNAVWAERQGRHYLYRPLIERAHYVDEQTRDLVDRLFGGDTMALVRYVLQAGRFAGCEPDALQTALAQFAPIDTVGEAPRRR